MSKPTQLHCLVSPEMRERLRSVSEATRVPASAIIRRGLTNALEVMEKTGRLPDIKEGSKNGNA